MRWEQQVQYAAISDIGLRRRNNQDSQIVQICSDQETWERRGHLFIVADGMGGHAVGELASKMAVDAIPHAYFKSQVDDLPLALKSALEDANSCIHARGMQNFDFRQMGTTCVSLVLCPRGAVIGHVGDSRVYRIRGERIEQLTFDHSLQWELVRLGKIKPDEMFLHEMRHVITRSLGPEASVEVDIEGPYAVLPNDTYLLCSDGLTGHVRDAEIGTIARELPPDDAARLLVNLANLRGGADNITVVIARVTKLAGDAAHAGSRTARRGSLGRLVAAVGRSVASLLKKLFMRRTTVMADTETEIPVEKTPYAYAAANLNRKFLNQLAAAESNLQRSALEEGWSLDWSAHEAAFNAAKKALNGKDYALGLRELSRTIDVLMTGLRQQRKQLEREAKWGKSSQSSEK